METIDPFLKWPGGKRWLVQKYGLQMPSGCKRYMEPFLGSGAVYFYLKPTKAVLSDSNQELINAYKCIRDFPDIIDRRLKYLHKRHGEKLYYKMRNKTPKTDVGKAIRFIYLNRTCFNGIYRVNLKGEFNVPMGSKSIVQYPAGYLDSLSRLLKYATLKVNDFENTIDMAGDGDFLFVDPPYTVKHNNNNFIKYNAHLFSWADQVRLSSAIRRAASRGAHIMLSNADHSSIRMLYCDFGNHNRVDRASVLAADSQNRCRTTELLITTFKTKMGEQVAGEEH